MHVALLDAVIFEIVLVDGDPHARHGLPEAVVDVDDERDRRKGFAQLSRDGAARLRIGP